MLFKKRRKKISLEPGDLCFEIPLDDGTKQDWRVDLVTAKLLCETVERNHNLKLSDEGTLQPTPDFLDQLSESFVNAGCPRCTPKMAHNAWLAINRQFIRMEIKFRRQMRQTLGD